MKTFYQLISIFLSWLVLSCYLCRPTLGVDSIRCLDKEKKALIQFKRGIKDDFCGLLTSWEDTSDCCQWRGVGCSNQTGHVIMLRLEGQKRPSQPTSIPCIQGEFSFSLGELKHLRYLNLNYNYFYYAPFPRFLLSLTNLEHLSLSNANFEGEIPHQLGNLSKLTTLDLSSNNLLSVESLGWLSRLTLLRNLDLSSVDLRHATNWMQIVTNLPSLRVLRMQSCLLPVKVPLSLTYDNFSATLDTINLSDNDFNDTAIYQWLFNLPGINTQLVSLDISMNLLQGPIPSEVLNMHSLTYLSLSDNNFQGSTLELVSKLCNVQHLYLRDNNFTDELTSVIEASISCENKSLLTLDLSHNHLWGDIPDSISSLSSLRELYLDGNQLSGEISQGIGQLIMLEKLGISSSSLETTLTHSHFSNLSSLRELYLSDNPRLVINIVGNWIPPFQLDIISLSSCNLGPQFPNWLQTQKNFSYFDVSNTKISDSIPVSIWSSFSSNLLYSNMSYNQLYGVLPNLPETLKYVFVVDLSSNLLEGAIPTGFTNVDSLYLNNNRFSDSSYFLCTNTAKYLTDLDLSNNLLSGELSDCWMKFSQLSSLHLENNRFSGNLPMSIGTLKYLRYLHLYNNSFSGPLPSSFQNCTSLVILNLGYNAFSGYIPPWMGDAFQSLGALILRRNFFLGELPVSLCQLGNLQILDLAFNNISGTIPNCIDNYTAMIGNSDFRSSFIPTVMYLGRQDNPTEEESALLSWKREVYKFKETVGLVKFIDLSGNELSGEIPDGISRLAGLLALDLSRNKLSGSIPFDIGNLTALEFLDLSNNHLTGGIPVSLTKVSSLGILDLSNNNLSGEIPLSTQLQGFNATSYMGNPGLCGPPLPMCPKEQSPSNYNYQHDDYGIFPGLYISIVLGFIVGFWGSMWHFSYQNILETCLFSGP